MSAGCCLPVTACLGNLKRRYHYPSLRPLSCLLEIWLSLFSRVTNRLLYPSFPVMPSDGPRDSGLLDLFMFLATRHLRVTAHSNATRPPSPCLILYYFTSSLE